jgi:hypothetical protein
MRAANREWMLRIYDTGFIPEADRTERTREIPAYDYMRSGNVNLEEIIDVAEMATTGNKENLDKLISYLQHPESAVRYWAASGLLILGENAASAKEALTAALGDQSPNVVSVAAEALYGLGEKEPAKKALLGVLEGQNEFARCHALNVIDCTGDASPEIIEGTIQMIKRTSEMTRNSYDLRAARWLTEKWGINPEDHQLVFNW